jgi:hypothetical protein
MERERKAEKNKMKRERGYHLLLFTMYNKTRIKRK